MNGHQDAASGPALRHRLDAQLLRRAFGQFATGIAVIGARAPDGTLVGMTVNSFASASLEPPLVMFCPAKALEAYEVYRTVRHFSASVLSAAQQPLSERFARRGAGKWAGVPHALSESGLPLIQGALACFECETQGRFDAGDHSIVLGRVLALAIAGEGEPLVFHRSRYARLALAAGAAPETAASLAWGL